MAAPKKAQPEAKKVAKELQAFADARKRPAVFLFVEESLHLKHVMLLRASLGNRTFEELDLVVNSGGGSIHAVYQIVELLRMHTKKLTACVPFYAKSAATLLCVGADEIILDDLAQLGPLDTQVYEEKRGGKGQFNSALNPFKTLEQLQKFSLESLDIAVKMISLRSGMDLDDCLKHGIEFVRATTGPLFAQLNPEKLGEYSRALSVGTEYGQRLLRRFKSDWDQQKRDEVLEKLVHGYPSHDYIIDYHELQEIGFEARLFEGDERGVVLGLYRLILDEKSAVELVEPTAVVKQTAAQPPATQQDSAEAPQTGAASGEAAA